jgi:hypothetical protein
LAGIGVEIEYFKAKGFFRSEVIGKRPLRHSRSLDYVANARAPKPPLVHDAETFGQYLVAIRRLTHINRNMYVRIETINQLRFCDLARALPHM